MAALPAILTLAHLIGLSLAMGAATVKLALLIRSRHDHALLTALLAVSGPVTRVIITGMVLLALSGIGWLLVAYDLTPLLIVKLLLFGSVFVLGPIIDNVAEPKFRTLAPAAGGAASPAFLRARQRYLALEVAATILFYAIVVLWAFR